MKKILLQFFSNFIQLGKGDKKIASQHASFCHFVGTSIVNQFFEIIEGPQEAANLSP